jgi:hypothetical protein
MIGGMLGTNTCVTNAITSPTTTNTIIANAAISSPLNATDTNLSLDL